MKAPAGFEYVPATQEEISEHVKRHGHTPSMYRLRCLHCGNRIWGSGLGIGAHRRMHRREARKRAEVDE